MRYGKKINKKVGGIYIGIFIIFWNGGHSQFDEWETIEQSLGKLSLCEDGKWYEYSEDDIKEIILVNDYTITYAIGQGYEV